MAVSDDKDIVATLRQNAEKGCRLLMAKYGEPIYWHIRRIVSLHDDAEDAAQETFVRVFRSIEQFKGESSFAVWLYRIATNEALRIVSKRQPGTLSIDDESGTIAHSVTTDEYVDYSDLEAVKLQKAILALPTKQQLAFNLRYYEEMSYEEIAQITSSTPTSAKVNYHVAKEKIIQFMNSND